MKLKKGDKILVISGKDKGKQGSIEKAYPKERKIVVLGVNVVKKHLKPSRKNPHGGLLDKPAPIAVENVVVICPRCTKPTRIGYKITKKDANYIKMRICKKCQESID